MKLTAGTLSLVLGAALGADSLPIAPPFRPVVAIVGQNQYTETTDFLVPFAVLKQSGVAQVVTVSTKPGPLELFPALSVWVDSTAAEFETRYPEGADYVVVPAVHREDDPALLNWVRSQAARGAVIVGVCDGVRVVGAAGLLEGKRAVGHWYSLDELQRRHRTTTWVKDRRYLRDGSLITTTGVSASVPVSLFLVEVIAGRAKAEATAQALGLAMWSEHHDGPSFQSRGMDYGTIAGNAVLALFSTRRSAPVAEGFDELALALAADAYGRTGRSPVVAVSKAGGGVMSKRGLLFSTVRQGEEPLRSIEGLDAGLLALDRALAAIEGEFGAATANMVASQEEYQRGELTRWSGPPVSPLLLDDALNSPTDGR